MKSSSWAFFAGALFSVGLVLGGMTQPARVIGFLDFFGSWDPSLMFVMGGAVVVHFALFRVITKRRSPLFDERFHLPTRKDIDGRLVIGAALFGIGWGLVGYCPGPALVSLATGQRAIVFTVALLAGMAIHHMFEQWSSRAASVAAVGDAK